MEQMKGFSTLTAFQLMDIKRFNYLDWESIFYFLRAFAQTKEQQPTKLKLNAIFRRLDLNADVKISFQEFANAIKPIDVYFVDDKKSKSIVKRTEEGKSKNIESASKRSSSPVRSNISILQ